jgi:tripartite-type tricarboxylate transporter receptor subunit TctC
MMFASIPSVLPQVKSGQVNAIAMGSAKRVPSLPDIPTLSESGYKGFETSQWYGIMAPAGTPQAVIDRLQKDITKALKSKEESKRMLDDGAVLVGDTPAQFSAFIKSEQGRWGKVVEKAKITID